MAVDFGPRLGLLINADIGEAYYDQFRPFLQAIDALLLCAVINSSTLTPPASPSNGDAYLLIGSPTGAWAGKGNNVAVWSTEITEDGNNTKVPGWNFYAPNAGWMVWNTAVSQFYVFNGSSWNTLQTAQQIALQTNGAANTSQSKLNLVAGSNITITSDGTGDVTVAATGSGTPSFSGITSGTNVTATMLVGSGASLGTTGGGVVSANQVNGVSVPASAAVIATNSSAQIVAASLAGAGAAVVTGPNTSTIGDVVTYSTTTGQIEDSGVAISSLAPLASPALTGVPTAPTATLGTNTNQVATTAFVEAAIGGSGGDGFNLIATGTNTTATMTVGTGASITTTGSGIVNANEVNGAVVPASAKALASNASNQVVAATVAGAGAGLTSGPTTSVSGDVATFTGTAGQVADSGVLLSSLAPLASPALTGTPTGPTATAGTNTTQLATTAFVETAVAGAGGSAAFNAITTGTNTSATMTVGSGASLLASGTGSINSTLLSGLAITGSGAAVTTGPTSSTTGHLTSFTGTTGQLQDSGIASSNVGLLNATQTWTGAQNTYSGNVAINNNTLNVVSTAFGSSQTVVGTQTIVFDNPTPPATASNSPGSATMTYATSYWNGSGAVTAGVALGYFAGASLSGPTPTLGTGGTNPLMLFAVVPPTSTPPGGFGVFIPNLYLGGMTISHTATAGSDTLPTNPAGFIEINVNGTFVKMPYYSV